MEFSFNLGLFRAFFDGKIRCQKLAKSKANPLQKSQFFEKFFGIKKLHEMAKQQPDVYYSMEMLERKFVFI